MSQVTSEHATHPTGLRSYLPARSAAVRCGRGGRKFVHQANFTRVWHGREDRVLASCIWLSKLPKFDSGPQVQECNIRRRRCFVAERKCLVGGRCNALLRFPIFIVIDRTWEGVDVGVGLLHRYAKPQRRCDSQVCLIRPAVASKAHVWRCRSSTSSLFNSERREDGWYIESSNSERNQTSSKQHSSSKHCRP